MPSAYNAADGPHPASDERSGTDGYSTFSLPSIPPERWPGTEQKNVYSPGSSSTVTDSLPSAKTEVPASTSSIRKSCPRAASLVNSTVTVPAGAGAQGRPPGWRWPLVESHGGLVVAVRPMGWAFSRVGRPWPPRPVPRNPYE